MICLKNLVRAMIGFKLKPASVFFHLVDTFQRGFMWLAEPTRFSMEFPGSRGFIHVYPKHRHEGDRAV